MYEAKDTDMTELAQFQIANSKEYAEAVRLLVKWGLGRQCEHGFFAANATVGAPYAEGIGIPAVESLAASALFH